MAAVRLTAVVLGGGNTLFDDLERARALITPDVVIACNHAGRDHPGRVDHWATMHPELMPMWMSARARTGRPPAGQLWHARHRQEQVRRSGLESRPIESWGGSSGMLCIAVAYELGCTHILLCGVPMHQNARHYDSEHRWREARQYWAAWERRKPQMLGRVRSLSGWTMTLLGAPDKAWLDG